ncbi:predicted protein, partial [Nematostella vectensis]
GPLGLESHSIPDDHITASSHAPPTPPFNARLNNSVAWCAGDSYDCWLQVDLGGTHCVTSVATQGNPSGNNDYVKKYRLQYSLDGETWVTHEENGNQIFDANEDHDSVKTVSLQQPIVGRFVRFCPVEWYCWPCLRVELYGVLVLGENVTAKPLGLESKSLPDDRITASSVANAPPTPPSNARLNNSVAWCAGDSYDCWLQVDLGGTHRVTSVATQGNPKGNNDYVKKYRLQYSLDDESWVTHEENGNQIIDANEDHDSVKTVSLQQPIVGQFVRFCPVDWYFCPSLRVELYG